MRALHVKILELCSKFEYQVVTPLNEIVGPLQKFELSCNKGHNFSKRWNNLQQGERCPHCVKMKLVKNEVKLRNRTEEMRAWYDANSERVRRKGREYSALNRDKINAANSKRKENPEYAAKVSAYLKEWKLNNKDKVHNTFNKRYREDVSFRLGFVVRRQLIKLLNRKGISKSKRSKDFFDYDFSELKAHLESQFTLEMSWDNYGTFWHIDHIVPLASFRITGEDDPRLKEAWRLSNLRPLKAVDNILKSDIMPSGERYRTLKRKGLFS